MSFLICRWRFYKSLTLLFNCSAGVQRVRGDFVHPGDRLPAAVRDRRVRSLHGKEVVFDSGNWNIHSPRVINVGWVRFFFFPPPQLCDLPCAVCSRDGSSQSNNHRENGAKLPGHLRGRRHTPSRLHFYKSNLRGSL